jgi:hypothetical protein
MIGDAGRPHRVELRLHDRVGRRRDDAELQPPAKRIDHPQPPAKAWYITPHRASYQERSAAFAFDSLGYAKKLRDAGVPQDQAAAQAEAAREFVMTELVTRNDLEVVRRELEAAINTTRHDLEAKLNNLGLRLTIRMGIMLAAGLSLLGAVLKLHS